MKWLCFFFGHSTHIFAHDARSGEPVELCVRCGKILIGPKPSDSSPSPAKPK